MTPNEWLKDTAKAAGTSARALMVLDATNDPFNVGQPAHLVRAQWVAELHRRHPAAATHLRRLHYRALSDPTPKPDGSVYLNTDPDWKWLQDGAKKGRHLGLIDQADIVDKRSSQWRWNDSPDVRGRSWYRPDPLSDVRAWLRLPDLADADLSGALDIDVASPAASPRYRYDDVGDVRIGVVVEKSTIDDVMVPLCDSLHLDYLAATGFVSHTRIAEWLQHDTSRPARLLYVSDFDPAGDKMPQAFARQLEFLLWRFDIDLDVALHPLALTFDQVRHYDLPTVPLSLTDAKTAAVAGKRRNFMTRYDVPGAVELDALVATHPGAMETLVRDAVTDLRDETWPRRLLDAEMAAFRMVDAVWQRHREHIDSLTDDVAQRVQVAWDTFVTAVESVDVTDLTAAVAALNADVAALELPPRPEPQREDREHHWMFRSDRPYMEQLNWYTSRHGSDRSGSGDA